MFMYSYNVLLSHISGMSFIRCIVVIIVFFISEKISAQGLTYDQLEEAFLTINSQMPYFMGNGMEMSSVSIDRKEVTYRFRINDLNNSMISITTDNHEVKERMKSMVSVVTSDENAKVMFVSMAKLGIGLRLQMTSVNTGKTVDVRFLPEEVMEIATKPAITPFEWVKNWHHSVKEQLPMNLGEGITMTDAILSESMMQYICVVNEAVFSFDIIVGNRESVRESICTLLFSGADAVVIMQTTQMALAGLSLSYKYVGSDSGKTMYIDFSNQELRERMHLESTEYEDSIATYEEEDSVAVEW